MEQRIEAAAAFLLDWLKTNVLTWETAAQWGCVLAFYLLGVLAWRGFEKRLLAAVDRSHANHLVRSVLRALVDIGNVAGFFVVMLVCEGVFSALGYNGRLLNAAGDLALAWIAIRLLTSVMPNRAVARGVAGTIWTVAALSVFGLLTPVTDFLRGLNFTVGDASFNALGVINGLALAFLFIQVASLVSQFFEGRIQRNQGLTPSLQVLLGKALKTSFYTVAVLAAMSSVGIDLTSLAIFSSALGVGIGFGLKTIFSNYVAGIILLMDNSIKPGDTIEVGGVFGVVRDMRGRYASVLTRSGKEHLIPNELLISGEVVNWTHNDRNVRIGIPVGIAYWSDVDTAMVLMERATEGVSRVLRDPSPTVLLSGFGDSSVDLELRIWIRDAEGGVSNVKSEIMLKIWKLFHEYDIEFPFPQRDILLKPDSRLAVTIEKGGDDG
ncbi:mechanosensitive ion channel [Pseudodesulfovibrio cashew]|uniref:Mechanosensitive ion channel n=1 Tax=Pseudodesulfovibrio cashew TaxID=2678688 RepID=A0A6I6JDS6_9BACT|nr:mechanosensitive ion channel domain-containing protein [Pseudodesulfovibrio cashew]QGY39230.1 mechanosensitive ion channel [Pseudodesulfovibrio cashew]